MHGASSLSCLNKKGKSSTSEHITCYFEKRSEVWRMNKSYWSTEVHFTTLLNKRCNRDYWIESRTCMNQRKLKLRTKNGRTKNSQKQQKKKGYKSKCELHSWNTNSTIVTNRIIIMNGRETTALTVIEILHNGSGCALPSSPGKWNNFRAELQIPAKA